MKKRSSFGQHTLDRRYFVTDEMFAAEHEKIFFRSWLLAGHVSQLEKAGSYFLFELERESVIVVRDEAGEIRAFHNHCRHRGSRLCHEHQGTLGKTILCPYHAWSYGLDGALRGAPSMNEVEGFSAGDYPLHGVALANWEGFLFVNLAKDPQPFAASLPGLIGRFKQWQPSELVAADRRVYEVDANWKMFFHNFSECYHCPLAHPQLNKLTPFRNSENDLDEGTVLGGPMGMNNLEGSMTIGGERCAPPFSGLTEHERARVYYYTLFPGAFISFHPDYVMVHRAVPLAIDRYAHHLRMVFPSRSRRRAGIRSEAGRRLLGHDQSPGLGLVRQRLSRRDHASLDAGSVLGNGKPARCVRSPVPARDAWRAGTSDLAAQRLMPCSNRLQKLGCGAFNVR
jgi:Phenylpropionate dioxygenase and related ring-hydroxylating dioxygenases, large terminal subunit